MSDRDMEEIAKLVGLHEFIANLKEGYSTRLGSDGLDLPLERLVDLSVARALATRPAVLTVDDTFSRIDEGNETRLRKVIQTALDDHTVVIATSRLSICEDADLIFVLRQGELIESGTFSELLGHPGLFRRMYTRQAGHPEPPKS